ncbi:MAG: dTMP kinase [Bacteroidales bacterium]
MNLIVIEGLDGAGKSTQIRLLQDYFEASARDYRYLHFPRTGAPFFGELIARFLRGEFGSLDQVDPWLVAMLYAGDRRDAAEDIRRWLDAGIYVLLDRYVYSNIAYQCAKLNDIKEAEALKEWIFNLEFNHFGIPRPSLNIFLDVPLSFTRKKLQSRRNGNDRSYLKGSNDIHESNLAFQSAVRDVYLKTAETDPTLRIADCSSDDREMMSAESIHKLIINLLTENKVLT